MKFDNGSSPNITGGPLGKSVFILHSFHIHYGGSEHSINDTKYEAELHLIHFNSKYIDFNIARKFPDGLAVLGFFYSSKPKNVTIKYLPYWSLLTKIQNYDSSYTESVDVFSYRDLIKQNNVNVASYQGSLTVPSCEESVTWMVAPSPLPISKAELTMLRSVQNCEGNPSITNSRPTQDANGRNPTIFAAHLGATGWFNPRLIHR